ncbi:MAG: extracellular solute-binding protein, partial [Chloroflexi bacterium]|nr:extracellular solute-binding protein [Chloroflexota bacterium]
IQDLGPFGRADKTSNLDESWPPVKVANTVNGKWPYELQFDLSTICVYYHKDMFKRAGVPDPNDKLPEYWTFDEFREAARKLTGTGPAGQQWGVTGRLSLFNAVAPLMESNGGGLINLENTKTLLDRPESIEMMEKVAELFYKDKLAPTAQEARDIPLFESGRTAMSVTSPERALWYRERIKDFEWDLAPLPVSSKTKVKRNWVQSGGLSMSSITTQPEAAWNFLNYYMSAENLVELMGKPSRGIPGRPSVKNSLLRPDQPPKHMHHFIDAVDFGTCSVFTNFDEFNKILGPASEAIYDGKRPVAEMFREIAPKIQALLPK